MANKYAHLNEPQRELDLHHYERAEALHATRDFISECMQDGIERALIITGKGKHSPNGAVLQPAVRSYLHKEGIDHQSAKPNQGGDGAVFIRLEKN